MKWFKEKRVAMFLIVIVLFAALVLAAKPLAMISANADLRTGSDTAFVKINAKSLDSDFTGSGKYTLEFGGVIYNGDILFARAAGTTAFLTGATANPDEWVYLALRDNGKINDIAWIEVGNESTVFSNFDSGAFPGEGWAVEKGKITVR